MEKQIQRLFILGIIIAIMILYVKNYQHFIVFHRDGPTFTGFWSIIIHFIAIGWPFAIIAGFFSKWHVGYSFGVSIIAWFVSWAIVYQLNGPNCGDAYMCFMTPNFLLFISALICHGIGRGIQFIVLHKDVFSKID